MACDNCKSDRILAVGAGCDDRCSVNFNGVEQNDYAPRDIGIGGGDYLDFRICLDCGKVQGKFPLEDPEFYQVASEEE